MRTNLPPEAFTRETLQEAFQWLQAQSEPVRATIHTPEGLVSLYRKAQRLDQNSDTPVSSKKFIDDLKNLATSLDEFASPERKKEFVPPSPQTPTQPIIETFVEPKIEPKKILLTKEPVSPLVPSNTVENKAISSGSLDLDLISRERVNEVKIRFNLSSENEALRLLISLGFEKFSKFN